MTKAEQRANELFPNDRTFCGGVASIARDAYVKGYNDAMQYVYYQLNKVKDAIDEHIH